jgi:hypothetical protein
LFGRHFVLRAMQSRADADGFAVSFDALSPAERADFLRELRVHRETAVLLHEWAHTLGAVHECTGKSLMAPRYSVLQAEFSPESLPVIRAGLAHRGTRGIEARRAWAEAYRRAARNMADAAWNCPEQESALVEAQSTLDKLAVADGALRTGESKLRGAIDPERVRKVIRDHEAQVRYCYEQQLARDPKVEGKVSIRWQIDPDGHASNATVNRAETTLPGDEVPECIMSRVVTWEFPKPSSGGLAIVTYPWILRTTAANGATSEAKRAAPPEATRGPPRTTR